MVNEDACLINRALFLKNIDIEPLHLILDQVQLLHGY